MLDHNTLIVVADGHSARLFRVASQQGEALRLDEKGALTPQDLKNEGPSGHMPEDESARDLNEATFAKQLAHHLNRIVLDHKAEAVVIAADPATLGQLRKSYHGELSRRIVREIPKRLNAASVDDLAAALR